MVRSSVPPQLEMLPGMPDTPLIAADLDGRHSLAALLRPERQGLQAADYADISPQAIAAAEPEALRTSIFDARQAGAARLYFYGDDKHRHTVAASDREFKLLAGNLATLGDRAAESVRQHHQSPQNNLTDVGRSAAVRGGAHAVERQAQLANTFLHKTLQPELDLLKDLSWAAMYPGFARGNSRELALRQQIERFHTLVLGRMLQAIGTERNWTNQQATLARRTIDRRMFIDRADNRHIAYFGQLVALAYERDEALRAVTQTRLHQAAHYITRHTVEDAN